MALTVALHPLVLLSISDHSARSKAQKTPERRAGILFGTQIGHDVEIIDTNPMNFKDMSSTEMDVDHDDLQSCIQLHKAVYSAHELLGWYAYGDTTSLPEFSHKIQQEMEQYNESPLFLYFTISKEQSNSLPVSIYTFSQQDKKHIFIPVPFSIATEEAETLTVDYLSNQLVTRGANPLALHFRSLAKAIAIMASRINVLLQYLKSDHGDDPEILRSVKSICDSLPLADPSSSFQSAITGEFSDSLLITQCASITRGTESIQQLLAKCRIAYDDSYEQRKRRAFI